MAGDFDSLTNALKQFYPPEDLNNVNNQNTFYRHIMKYPQNTGISGYNPGTTTTTSNTQNIWQSMYPKPEKVALKNPILRMFYENKQGFCSVTHKPEAGFTNWGVAEGEILRASGQYKTLGDFATFIKSELIKGEVVQFKGGELIRLLNLVQRAVNCLSDGHFYCEVEEKGDASEVTHMK